MPFRSASSPPRTAPTCNIGRVNFLRHWLLALQYFTRIPVTGSVAQWAGYTPERLRASAAHFPGIGFVVGTAAVAVYALVFLALPASSFAPLAAAAFSTVATVLLTGGLHEDGLADLADGLGGSYDRERALEIMKDSRVGAFGAMALALALLCKVSLLAVLGSAGLPAVCAAILGAHVASRALPLVLIRALPHVGDTPSSKSKPLADRISGPALLAGFAWLACAAALEWRLYSALFFLAGTAAACMALLLMWRLLRRRLQGFTGDGLGATQQVCEIAFYLGFAAALQA
jgi:adenosylcobinamide-GDP ribazoletransferase